MPSVGGESSLEETAASPAQPGRGAIANLARGAVLGRHTILEQVGSGGMGVVYAAFDSQLSRKVAIKVLRPLAGSRSSEVLKARLVREARALAQLSHPNVVAVHEVGEAGDELFVVMDFIEGETLGERCRALDTPSSGSWREVLKLYLDAGKGLAAAHAAGLVHRDFKPDNVLVGNDGAVRVMDFGLARSTDPGAPPGETQPVAREGLGTLEAVLTQEGAVVGTPAYMAPEQFLGGATDARTDQFSFCVALHEGLYGERPFAGERFNQLARAVTRGEVREAPKGAAVPGRLRKALLRGLAVDPRQRFPSMEALLEELSNPLRVRPWRFAVASVLLLLSVGGGAWLSGGWHRDRAKCLDDAKRASAAWNAPAREAVNRAFIASKSPSADFAWRRVDESLSRFAEEWGALALGACEPPPRVEQAEPSRELQKACLARRLEDLKALADVFAQADAKTVENSIAAVESLPGIGGCAAGELTPGLQLPKDGAARAGAVQALALVSKARALLGAGRAEAAIRAAKEAVASAQAVLYGPAEGEGLLVLAESLEVAQHPGDAVSTLSLAANAAESAGDDATKFAALAAAARISGVKLRNPLAAQDFRGRAEAVRQRLPKGDVLLDTELHRARAAVFRAEQRFADAAGEYREGLDALQRAGKSDSVQAFRIHFSLSAVYFASGDAANSIHGNEADLAHAKRIWGDRHPQVASVYLALGEAYVIASKFAEAVAAFQSAAALLRANDQRDVRLANVLNSTGNALLALGKPREALSSIDEAFAILEQKTDTRSLIDTLSNAGLAHLIAGEPDQARPLLQRALSLAETQTNKRPTLAALDKLYLLRAEGTWKRDPTARTELVRLADEVLRLVRDDPYAMVDRLLLERWLDEEHLK